MEPLLRRRRVLLAEFERYSEFVRGSITSVCATCHRARCICAQTSPRRSYRLTYKARGQQTRIVYVPGHRLPRIRRMIANYARLRKLIEQLMETNIAVFKQEPGR
jgi:hypothetical protein